MGDNYAKAFSKGLKEMNPTVVNLADNRLTKNGSRSIIKNLRPAVRSLDFSQNVIDEIGASSLGEFAKLKANDLRQLDLENTRLGDSGVISLCKQLVDHPKLNTLNLSKNKITDVGCVLIAELVNDTFYLGTLLLHWNYITGDGASKILAATTRYGSMKVIDLSWNSIGRCKTKVFVKQFSEILTTQETLMHLDLSHNKLKEEDCKNIATALVENHTLWGLHFSDNGTYSIDSKGFLNQNVSRVPIGMQVVEDRISTLDSLKKRFAQKDWKSKRLFNCWICEGWSEAIIEFPQLKPNEPVYLNLECDDYNPDTRSTPLSLQSCLASLQLFGLVEM